MLTCQTEPWLVVCDGRKKMKHSTKIPFFSLYSSGILALSYQLNITSCFLKDSTILIIISRIIKSNCTLTHRTPQSSHKKDGIFFNVVFHHLLLTLKETWIVIVWKFMACRHIHQFHLFLKIFHFETKSLFKTRLLNMVSKNRSWLWELFPVVFSYFARNGHGANEKMITYF